jgi:hypothetical protein
LSACLTQYGLAYSTQALYSHPILFLFSLKCEYFAREKKKHVKVKNNYAYVPVAKKSKNR